MSWGKTTFRVKFPTIFPFIQLYSYYTPNFWWFDPFTSPIIISWTIPYEYEHPNNLGLDPRKGPIHQREVASKSHPSRFFSHGFYRKVTQEVLKGGSWSGWNKQPKWWFNLPKLRFNQPRLRFYQPKLGFKQPKFRFKQPKVGLNLLKWEVNHW
jgi:hypothetical protein